MKMDVDAHKLFSTLINTKYLKDHYFVESCINFTSKYSEEVNLNSIRLKIFLEENNWVSDIFETRKYCDLKASLKGVKLNDISGKVIQPTKTTIVENREINYITYKDVWEQEDF